MPANVTTDPIRLETRLKTMVRELSGSKDRTPAAFAKEARGVIKQLKRHRTHGDGRPDLLARARATVTEVEAYLVQWRKDCEYARQVAALAATLED